MCSRHALFRPTKPNPPQCPDFSGFFVAIAASVADCAAVVNIARLFIYEPSFFFALPILMSHTLTHILELVCHSLSLSLSVLFLVHP